MIRAEQESAVSPEAIESILKGEIPDEPQQERGIDFVWVWFTDDQVEGPEVGEAMDLASRAGGFVDTFAPIVAIWFGLFATDSEYDVSEICEELTRFTADGAKLIRGSTSGVPRNIGSQNRMSYTVISPDRPAILTQLAKAPSGTALEFEIGRNEVS